MLSYNRFLSDGSEPAASLHPRTVMALLTIDSPPRGSPHFRRVRVAISPYLDAEVGLHRDAEPASGWSRHAAGGTVIGAYGDSTFRSGYPDGAWRRRCSGMPRPCQLRLIGQICQPGRSQIRRFLKPA